MSTSQPIYTQTLWDGAGKPYWRTTDGGRMYIPPIVAAQYRNDPKLLAWAQSQGAHVGTNGAPTVTGAPEGGGLHTGGTWNDQTGQYDQSLDWGNILAAGNAGAIAAPFIAGLGATAATAPSAGTVSGSISPLAPTIGGPGLSVPSVFAGGSHAIAPSIAGGFGRFLTSPVGAQLVGGGMAGIANIYAANKGANAASESARLQAEGIARAQELQSRDNAETLKFLKEQEATRKAEQEKAQSLNYGIYQDREANLQPYRNWGIGAMAQLGRPIGAA